MKKSVIEERIIEKMIKEQDKIHRQLGENRRQMNALAHEQGQLKREMAEFANIIRMIKAK